MKTVSKIITAIAALCASGLVMAGTVSAYQPSAQAFDIVYKGGPVVTVKTQLQSLPATQSAVSMRAQGIGTDLLVFTVPGVTGDNLVLSVNDKNSTCSATITVPLQVANNGTITADMSKPYEGNFSKGCGAVSNLKAVATVQENKKDGAGYLVTIDTQ